MNTKNDLIQKTELSALCILSMAVLISIILFWQKFIFLTSLVPSQSFSMQYVLLLAINAASYLAIIFWAYLLLKYKTTIWLKIFVVFTVVVFFILTRLTESGEEVTRQGIDFSFVRHFFLSMLGHSQFSDNILTISFQWGLFLVLFSGLLWKLLLNKAQGLRFPLSPLILFFLCLIVSFISPTPKHIPKSLGQNGLIYVIKTAWLPVVLPAINPVSNVGNIFGERAEEPKNIKKTSSKGPLYSAAKGMNIAIIALESTSANALSFYPKSDGIKGNTPFMNAMSQHSLLFNETSSVMASTTKSIVSILCGIEPYLSTNTFEVTLGIPVDCLAERLSNLNYDSVFFQSATKYYEGRDRLIKHTGIKEFFSIEDVEEEDLQDKHKIGPLGYEDDVLLKLHKAWLERQVLENNTKPFMAFYMTLAQHHPYLKAPKERNNSQPEQSDISAAYLKNYHYSLAYIDAYIEKIVGQYKAQGLYENTLFVFVGDHGESFGRYHRPWFHNNVLYREGVSVPFFISNEKLFHQQKLLEGQFSLIDVAPTLEYLLGMSEADSYRGKNVLDQDNKNAKIFSACWYHNRCLSVADNQYKYIFNFGDSPDELFSRSSDFREQNNIAEQRLDLVQKYKKDVLTWHNEALSLYENYYESINASYLSEPESFYRFPVKIIPD